MIKNAIRLTGLLIEISGLAAIVIMMQFQNTRNTAGRISLGSLTKAVFTEMF